MIIVRPAPGIKLKDPSNFNRPIDKAGSPVDDNAYWRRRIADGDAILVPDDQRAAGAQPGVQVPNLDATEEAATMPLKGA